MFIREAHKHKNAKKDKIYGISRILGFIEKKIVCYTN